MSKRKSSRSSSGRRKRLGRKPLSAHGLERRDRKVLASFTASEFALLEAAADEEGVTVSELVARRAVGRGGIVIEAR